MNTFLCKYEQETLTALRSGPLSHELRAHVTGCAECSEVMFLAQVLQRDADCMGEISIPDAHAVWQRALRRSRAEAAARAARPIQWAVHASIAIVIAAAFWLVRRSPAWFGSLPWEITSRPYTVTGMWIAVSFLLGAVTILAALFGAVYILQADRAPVALTRT